jgi:hypothetical protein
MSVVIAVEESSFTATPTGIPTRAKPRISDTRLDPEAKTITFSGRGERNNERSKSIGPSLRFVVWSTQWAGRGPEVGQRQMDTVGRAPQEALVLVRADITLIG